MNNTLEKEMDKAMMFEPEWNKGKAAAAIAKKWIEKALSEAYNKVITDTDITKRMEYNEWALKWLKDNGIE